MKLFVDLSEKDTQRLLELKKETEAASISELVRNLIREEYKKEIEDKKELNRI